MSQSDPQVRFDYRSTFDSEAYDYEKASRLYWGFTSQRILRRLVIQPGSKVLDIACGTGASAILAAEQVGPLGHVLAVDTSEQMLALAHLKAHQRELENIDFLLADMRRLDLPGAQFSAVLCILGIFYAEDLVDEVSRLWRLTAPGGKLAIVTPGPDLFKPVFEQWKAAVLAECPDFHIAQPWERATDPDRVRQMLLESGALNSEVILEPNLISLRRPEDWWTIVLGFTTRETMRELSPESSKRVQEKCLAWIRSNQISHLSFNVIYAIAEKKG